MNEKVLEILIDKIHKDYKDDISVMVIMGSTIYGATHKKSDLDLYFVPKTKRGYELAMVFILDGIGYDLWPISWDRLEGISKHQERITSILTEGKIVYHSSDEDLMRFEALKKRALDVSSVGHFMYLAKENFKKVYEPMYRLQNASNLTEARRASIHLINGLCHVISLLNLKMIKRGRSHLKHEVMQMALRPMHFDLYIDTVFESSDLDIIKNQYKILFDETHALVQSERQKHMGTLKTSAQGFFEEIINNYNKIEHGYEINDYKTPLFAAVEIEHELSEEVGAYNALNALPPLIDTYDVNDMKKLYEASLLHLKKLESILIEAGVKINRFDDLNHLKAYIDSL